MELNDKQPFNVENIFIQVMILITGAHKAFALYKAIEEGVNHMFVLKSFSTKNFSSYLSLLTGGPLVHFNNIHHVCLCVTRTQQ